MPDKVYEWHRFLQNIVKNFEMFFADELLEALDTLSWLHLLLVVCRLGSNSSRSFASGFYHGVLKKPWIKLPNDLEIRFSKELEEDLRNGKTDSLGLYELLLQNDNFLQKFEQFCLNDELMIYNLPELYQFIKTQIYFIIIHQQQVEGLFNKLDIKTYSNMSLPVKQSKLRLSSSKIDKKTLLEELKKQKRTEKDPRFRKYNYQPLDPKLLRIFLIIYLRKLCKFELIIVLYIKY